MSLTNQDILSISDLTLDQIKEILSLAETIKSKGANSDHLHGKVIASCFYEPSTRTRLSFEAAALKLGASVTGFDNAANTSSQKGESLTDSIKVIGRYADLIVLRHPLDGAARLAAEATDTPVINAGDGANKHPTQTLLDLFTIKECQGTLEELHIALIGDLKHARTVHSLTRALAHFNVRLYFIAPTELMLPEELCEVMIKHGIKYSFHAHLSEVLNKLDILYVTRLQKERFLPYGNDSATSPYHITLASLDGAKDNLRVLHPLPRVDELSRELDHTPYAYYFEQAANGIPLRQALLTLLLSPT